MQYLESGGSWQLTGSTYYQNPIEITVLDAPPVPDQYEPDNTAGTSYTLPVTFTGNSSSTGSTIRAASAGFPCAMAQSAAARASE